MEKEEQPMDESRADRTIGAEAKARAEETER
jgi:hypothetical protein